MLICASLEPGNAVESIQSLRFGEACSRVEMRSGRSGDGAATLRRMVDELDAEIAACQALIVRDQRWERRVTVKQVAVDLKDNFATEATHDIAVEDHAAGVMVVAADDGQTTKEVVGAEVVGNVLVGAEEHEARMEALLARRRELLGED